MAVNGVSEKPRTGSMQEGADAREPLQERVDEIVLDEEKCLRTAEAFSLRGNEAKRLIDSCICNMSRRFEQLRTELHQNGTKADVDDAIDAGVRRVWEAAQDVNERLGLDERLLVCEMPVASAIPFPLESTGLDLIFLGNLATATAMLAIKGDGQIVISIEDFPWESPQIKIEYHPIKEVRPLP